MILELLAAVGFFLLALGMLSEIRLLNRRVRALEERLSRRDDLLEHHRLF